MTQVLGVYKIGSHAGFDSASRSRGFCGSDPVQVGQFAGLLYTKM